MSPVAFRGLILIKRGCNSNAHTVALIRRYPVIHLVHVTRSELQTAHLLSLQLATNPEFVMMVPCGSVAGVTHSDSTSKNPDAQTEHFEVLLVTQVWQFFAEHNP